MFRWRAINSAPPRQLNLHLLIADSKCALDGSQFIGNMNYDENKNDSHAISRHAPLCKKCVQILLMCAK